MSQKYNWGSDESVEFVKLHPKFCVGNVQLSDALMFTFMNKTLANA